MVGGVITSLTPVVYVDDLAAARQFYGLIGFEELLTGDEGRGEWAYLRCGELSLLLATGDGGPGRGPVQLYCQTDDVTGLGRRLAAAQVPVEHLGNPAHAPGGEIRVVDPDGHPVMIAETAGAARDDRSGVLRRAAAASRERGQSRQSACQVGLFGGGQCTAPAEVKIVDSWGDGTWSCLPHAEELLFNVNSAFVASAESEGITGYLDRRRRMLPAQPGPV